MKRTRRKAKPSPSLSYHGILYIQGRACFADSTKQARIYFSIFNAERKQTALLQCNLDYAVDLYNTGLIVIKKVINITCKT